jgi:nucleoside-diphosphate-sugar epimerase
LRPTSISRASRPLYDEITVRGAGKLLRALQTFEVEQFLFASSMLAHKLVDLVL